MAYKFQLGAYTASGSLVQEGDLEADAAVVDSLNVQEGNITNVGDIALDSISADGASFSFGSNWTAASRTCADLGIVTTVDINGGSIDGATIGAASQSSIKATTMSASSTLQVGGDLTTQNANLQGAIINMPGVSAAALDSADFFLSLDSGSKDVQIRSRANVASDFAGAGLAASSGVLSVGVDDTGIEIDSDALRLKDNGVTLAKMAGLAAGKFILGDSNGNPAATTLSGDATVSDAGVVTIAANAIHDSMVNDDVATGLAGNGLGAASGVMSLDLNELSAVAIASGDFIPLVDATDNSSKKESIDDIATLFAGNGLAASSAVLAVQVSGAVHVSSDKVSISGSIAGNGISYVGGVNSVSSLTLDADPDSFSVSGLGLQLAANVAGSGIALATGVLSVDIDELAALGGTGIAQSDNLIFSDDGTEKKITFSNFEDAIFGNVSGDATIAAGGALTIANGAVENAMLANASVTLTQGAGMAAMGSVALGAAVTVAVDGVLEDLDTLGAASADGEFIVATGAGAFAYESGNTARTSLGLGTGDAVSFTSLSLSGDLTVAGTASFTHAEDFIIKDKNIIMASGSTGKAATAGGGIRLSYATDNSSYFEWVYKQNGEGDASGSGDIFSASGSAGLIDIQAAAIYSSGFVGDLTGDVTGTSSKVAVTDSSANTDFPIVFHNESDALLDDTGAFLYNPSTGLLTVGSIDAAVVSAVQNVDDSGTLVVGVNYWSDLGGAEAATLPASPSIGQSVFIKAPSNCSSTNTVTINKAGSQTIDGQSAIILESPFAAVQLVYVASNLWRVF